MIQMVHRLCHTLVYFEAGVCLVSITYKQDDTDTILYLACPSYSILEKVSYLVCVDIISRRHNIIFECPCFMAAK
ncbi:putative cellulose synthase A catalytic subunit 8 [UDP-forming] [Iris pallida]|uniref:Cellulose synthase A catalytic subunit 8 [UDP-forming] n=1 Tax=Iris pallida TaxID=29817 RepID=A0AAX6F5W5_IRIPA|nr:putative cellulose synthase A catalytic subunit 8 [UDP-forming] [Iris pallida]KAJ6830100.1 putative cellulose synthase A catalytic subunit 8 [UDP-forming] [Iris pallida]KAJ6843878.1 putative cellulose synthase A catalytic subunit 8 [UDP-forming] [Iris pallida]